MRNLFLNLNCCGRRNRQQGPTTDAYCRATDGSLVMLLDDEEADEKDQSVEYSFYGIPPAPQDHRNDKLKIPVNPPGGSGMRSVRAPASTSEDLAGEDGFGRTGYTLMRPEECYEYPTGNAPDGRGSLVFKADQKQRQAQSGCWSKIQECFARCCRRRENLGRVSSTTQRRAARNRHDSSQQGYEAVYNPQHQGGAIGSCLQIHRNRGTKNPTTIPISTRTSHDSSSRASGGGSSFASETSDPMDTEEVIRSPDRLTDMQVRALDYGPGERKSNSGCAGFFGFHKSTSATQKQNSAELKKEQHQQQRHQQSSFGRQRERQMKQRAALKKSGQDAVLSDLEEKLSNLNHVIVHMKRHQMFSLVATHRPSSIKRFGPAPGDYFNFLHEFEVVSLKQADRNLNTLTRRFSDELSLFSDHFKISCEGVKDAINTSRNKEVKEVYIELKNLASRLVTFLRKLPDRVLESILNGAIIVTVYN